MPDIIGGTSTMSFVTLLDKIGTSTLDFMGSIITDYWPWILGLVVLVAVARRFKRLVGLSR